MEKLAIPRCQRRFHPSFEGVETDRPVVTVRDRIFIEMHRRILKTDHLEFRLFQLLRVIRQFRLIRRRNRPNHVACQLCPQRREYLADLRIGHMVQGESLPQTEFFVFANDGHDEITGIPIERMGF